MVITWPQGIAFENLSQGASAAGLPSWRAGSAGRIIAKTALSIRSKLVRRPKAAALGVSLVLSALLTVAALRLPDQHWLAWISFLPLFIVVRSQRPLAAALAGAFWGGCLYLFFTTGPTPAINTVAAIGPSAWLLALLIVIPAVYLGLAARPARAIGFKLLTLALGWTLVEVILHLHTISGTGDKLLSGSVGASPHLHWVGCLSGYVFTAFLVACVNASLVGMLSRARLCFPVYRSFTGSPNASAWLPSRAVLATPSWTPHQAIPRAPPT
ncbi:MAG: hypothetical protein IH988_11240 [Planctomycetes bacterium]|nr:hypothetical protein [Planctomycetota bacterium]